MPRTRANRREVATPNGEQAESRTEDVMPVLLVAERPDVREAKARLGDIEEKRSAAEQRERELAEEVETARSRFQAIRARHVLGEATDEEVEEAQASLAGLEHDLAAAQDWATALRDTVAVLARRAQDVEAKAREEVDAQSAERLREVGQRLAEGAVALAPLARELFDVEEKRRQQGLPLVGGWSLAPMELMNVEGYRRVDNVDYAFGYHPADGSFLMEFLKRLRKIGVEVEPPEAVSLRDLVGREW